MANNNGIVRTTLAAAFVEACSVDNLRGKSLGRTSRRVVHRVLTNMARDVGVKYDPARKSNKKRAAVSAVMKEAA